MTIVSDVSEAAQLWRLLVTSEAVQLWRLLVTSVRLYSYGDY